MHALGNQEFGLRTRWGGQYTHLIPRNEIVAGSIDYLLVHIVLMKGSAAETEEEPATKANQERMVVIAATIIRLMYQMHGSRQLWTHDVR